MFSSTNRPSLSLETISIVPLLVFSLLISTSGAVFPSKIGVNYGQLGNNLPPHSHAIDLIKNTIRGSQVKLYDANPEILKALRYTNLEVTIMVPNELIINISKSQFLADQWVQNNVVPFYPDVKIRHVLIGNEILSDYTIVETWYNLVPAMQRIHTSLKIHKLGQVKVSSTMATDVFESVTPPSNTTFRADILQPIIKPMMDFLICTRSSFFYDVYTYFTWAQNPKMFSLDYALLKSNDIIFVDPDSKLKYTNLFDHMVDAAFFAMTKLGYLRVPIVIAETGWPNNGDLDQIGANVYNAATYNRNLVERLTSKPAIGTPAQPGQAFPTFIFALFNENQKGGPGTERHWGLLYPNGSKVYDIDLSGETPLSGYKGRLPPPTNDEPYRGKIWCVVAKGANRTALADAFKQAYSKGNKTTCDPIQPGRRCFKPNSFFWHASYVFSSYWAQFRSNGEACYFDGLAVETTKDPSFGHCKFPNVTP